MTEPQPGIGYQPFNHATITRNDQSLPPCPITKIR